VLLELRDKIACAQFILALPNGFVKRTLQLENITSLKTAVQRAMTVKVIQENNAFGIKGGQRQKFKFYTEKGFEKNNLERSKDGERKKEQGRKTVKQGKATSRFNREGRKKKECWQCEAKGHFRYKCPVDVTKQKGN